MTTCVSDVAERWPMGEVPWCEGLRDEVPGPGDVGETQEWARSQGG